MKSYEKQVAVILDMKKVEIRYNSEWLEDLGFKEMFVLMHFFTAKQILERDMFQRRIEKEKPIWLHEFIYPILQAYDSVALRADLEVGGSDQEFNLLAARQIQPHYKQAPQNILTVPLLIGVDGKEKMSQSLGNYVGLAEKPNEQFGKLMSIPDGLIKHYYELLTDVSEEELGDIARRLKEKKENPRDIKLGLAHVIVAQLNGTRAADMAREEFLNVFSKRESPKDIPVCKIKPGTPLREALHKAGVTASRSQADRLIMQGAIRVGEKRILEKDYVFTGDEPTVVKAGKHKFVKFTFSEK